MKKKLTTKMLKEARKHCTPLNYKPKPSAEECWKWANKHLAEVHWENGGCVVASVTKDGFIIEHKGKTFFLAVRKAMKASKTK